MFDRKLHHRRNLSRTSRRNRSTPGWGSRPANRAHVRLLLELVDVPMTNARTMSMRHSFGTGASRTGLRIRNHQDLILQQDIINVQTSKGRTVSSQVTFRVLIPAEPVHLKNGSEPVKVRLWERQDPTRDMILQ